VLSTYHTCSRDPHKTWSAIMLSLYFDPFLSQDMLIQKAETFGPVIAMSAFSGKEEDAVKLANDTEYGLASYVYTNDLIKASRVARKIKSGQVGINCYSLIAAQPKCPW
jgi:acyl-CoA reductase-like NAD-dependent aldehyde dehydrogenase